MQNTASQNDFEFKAHKFHHNQKRTFSYQQKDECWNNVYK